VPALKSKRGVHTRSPAQQRAQVALQLRQVDGLERFEVELPVLVARRRVAVDVVVVEGERDRAQPVDFELHRQAFDERRLARRARPGDADDAQASRGGDLVGEAPILFSWNPSATRMSSATRPETHASL
jgi:hypothetical protein